MKKAKKAERDFGKFKAAIAGEIRNRRKKIGLTQKEVAQRIGVLRESVARMENGRSLISLETLCKLCDLFECSLTEFIASVEGLVMLGDPEILQKVGKIIKQALRGKGLLAEVHIRSDNIFT